MTARGQVKKMTASKKRKHRCPKCPKCIDPVSTVREVAMVICRAFAPGGDPEAIMRTLQGVGAHHTLMQNAHPETDDQDGDAYAASLDSFEADLLEWLEEEAASHAEYMQRVHGQGQSG